MAVAMKKTMEKKAFILTGKREDKELWSGKYAGKVTRWIIGCSIAWRVTGFLGYFQGYMLKIWSKGQP
jgi:hypothetical protein